MSQELSLKNQELADILVRMGTLLEIREENVFKIRAYHKAAENIANLREDIQNLRREKRLMEIPGLGKAIAAKIDEYLDTGRLRAYEELTKEVPESLLELVAIPSVGPRPTNLEASMAPEAVLRASLPVSVRG